jgi:hypothetical protein
VRLTFIDSILGGEPGSSELHEDYIQTKIPEDKYTPEELERIKTDFEAAVKEWKSPDDETCEDCVPYDV